MQRERAERLKAIQLEIGGEEVMLGYYFIVCINTEAGFISFFFQIILACFLFYKREKRPKIIESGNIVFSQLNPKIPQNKSQHSSE